MSRSPERAYSELQKLARAQGRNTQQLFELYIHERFLARLAISRYSEQLVLKGGMLLAALQVRRTTWDAEVVYFACRRQKTRFSSGPIAL